MRRNHILTIGTAALALAASAAFTHAAVVWDGSESGVWTDGLNWVGDSAPASGNALEFGAAATYAVTNSPSTTFGTLKFLSTAGANYTLSGNVSNSEIYGAVTVEGSASASNHTISNSFRFNNKTFDVQSTSTSITFTTFDYGGTSRTLTKNGAGKLILTASANNPGPLQLNGGTVDYQNSVGTGNGAFKVVGSSSLAVVTNSTGTTKTLHFGYGGGGSATFAGSITGNLNVINGRTNAATSGIDQVFTSTSASTYSGTTTINNGVFTINGSHIGGGNYAVNSQSSGSGNGQLGGSGLVVLADSAKTFNFTGSGATAQAILWPGEDNTDTTDLTLGSLGVATTVNLNANSVLRVDVGAASSADRVDILGDLNLNAGSTLDLLSLGGAFDGSSYVITSYSGTRTGTFGTVNGLGAGYSIDYGTGSNSVITLAIPEPASMGLLAATGLLALRRRRTA